MMAWAVMAVVAVAAVVAAVAGEEGMKATVQAAPETAMEMAAAEMDGVAAAKVTAVALMGAAVELAVTLALGRVAKERLRAEASAGMSCSAVA